MRVGRRGMVRCGMEEWRGMEEWCGEGGMVWCGGRSGVGERKD